MKLNLKVLLAILTITTSAAMAGEPYSINCSQGKSSIFSASIYTPLDTTSTAPRVARVTLRAGLMENGGSFQDTINADAIKSLEHGFPTVIVVKNSETGASARVSINASTRDENTDEVLRTTGRVEMLDTGVNWNNLKCGIVLR
jgi:hypothetical protein